MGCGVWKSQNGRRVELQAGGGGMGLIATEEQVGMIPEAMLAAAGSMMAESTWGDSLPQQSSAGVATTLLP